ncbi:hypothetical protein ElyMa_006943600 [Elysia marginata]|uniref:Clustered mitochondria protein N-terminal domain-containing protein n=1 Tax=Elysia marginata TaxID=1093978 RepID=A0AAV4JIH7_9GAST|nr:hypothetical protein ElyMa_006943600 [Elysia marginata]
MAEAKPDETVGEPEADLDSIEVHNIQIGDYVIPGPVCLSAEAEVGEEVRRILRLANLTLDYTLYTFVVTDRDGRQVGLEHGDLIEDRLDDLTAPLHVEIVKFGDTPTGVLPNMNELNVAQK